MIKHDELEKLMFDTLTIFSDDEVFINGKIVNHSFTIQQLFFTYLIHKTGYDNSIENQSSYLFKPLVEYSESFSIQVKEKYMSWQAVNNPSMKWISKNYSDQFEELAFNHNNDFSWNNLDEYIRKYFLHETQQIGCLNKQEVLRWKVFTQDKEFPF